MMLYCFHMILNVGMYMITNVGIYMTTDVGIHMNTNLEGICLRMSQLYNYECRRYMATNVAAI